MNQNFPIDDTGFLKRTQSKHDNGNFLSPGLFKLVFLETLFLTIRSEKQKIKNRNLLMLETRLSFFWFPLLKIIWQHLLDG